MGTRSRIGLVLDDGSIKSVYCHWDGYLEHNGRLLVEHYANRERIEELLALGDLSFLGPEIGGPQEFDKARDGWCLAYGRDRGETGIEAIVDKTEGEFLDRAWKQWGEFAYLFRGGKWLFTTEKRGKWSDVRGRLSIPSVA